MNRAALTEASRIVAVTLRLASADEQPMIRIAADAGMSASALGTWRSRVKRSPSLAGVLAVLHVVGWTLVLKRIEPPEGEPIDLPAMPLRSVSDCASNIAQR